MGTATKKFDYSSYYVETYGDGDYIRAKSGGSIVVTSELYSMKKLISINSRFRGCAHWSYAVKHGRPDTELGGLSAGSTYTVQVIGRKSDNTDTVITSGVSTLNINYGDWWAYVSANENTLSYTPSENDKATYEYVYLKYTGSFNKLPSEDFYKSGDVGTGGNTGAAYGYSTIELKTSVPVKYNEGNEVESVKYGTTDITKLTYGTKPIF